MMKNTQTHSTLTFDEHAELYQEFVDTCARRYALDEETVTAYIDNIGYPFANGDYPDPSEIADAFVGCFDNWHDFAEDMIFEQGMLGEIPDALVNYIDVAAYAADLKYDFWEADNHFFRNN